VKREIIRESCSECDGKGTVYRDVTKEFRKGKRERDLFSVNSGWSMGHTSRFKTAGESIVEVELTHISKDCDRCYGRGYLEYVDA